MHTTGRFGTNAQSHTPAVAVSSAPLRPREQKCTRSSWLSLCMGIPPRDTFSVEVMIMVNKKLREHRQRAGIPLEILAYKARVSPRTLWRWERWNCTPRRWESIQRVAAVLGVEPSELLDDEQGGER